MEKFMIGEITIYLVGRPPFLFLGKTYEATAKVGGVVRKVKVVGHRFIENKEKPGTFDSLFLCELIPE